MSGTEGRSDRQDDLVPPTLGPPPVSPASPGASGTPGEAEGLVGRVLAGRYRIVEKLGEGAMGAVYLGEHLKIGRRDAIKVLRDDLATDREAIARFVRGTRNVSMIRHPNICTIYDYSDTEDGLQFVAMELVAGETLKDLLRREGALPVARAVEIAAQAADALDAAHEAGIVHRDLKPANIMVTRGRDGADVVKVVDFDIAKGPRDGEEAEVTRLGFVVGTPEYMSPEQLIGEKLDGRSDVYSLALVLFRMLTGGLPFRAESTQEVMIQRLTEQPLRLDEVLQGAAFPPALQAALDRALARKADERQQTAGELRRDLLAVLAPDAAPTPLAAPPPPRPAPGPATPAASATPAPAAAAPRPSRGRGVAVRLAAGVAILAVSGAAAAMLLDRGRAAAPRDPEPAGQVALRQEPAQRVEPPPTSTSLVPPAGGSLPAATVDTPSSAPAPAPEREEPRASAPAEPERPSASPSMTEAAADALLLRLLDRLTENPSDAALLTIRDSALVVWNSDAPTNKRGQAAYTVASTLLPLGDSTGAIQWLQRACRRPSDGARGAARLLQRLGSACPAD